MKRVSIALIALLLIASMVACSQQDQPASPANKVELLVSSAASLSGAMNEIKLDFEEKHPDISLVFHYGSSGKLAKQIEQGAPSDVFLSASKKDMDYLETKNLILEGTRADFAKNKLVLIGNNERDWPISSFEDIPVEEIQYIAIGEPDTVPAGRYAKEVLEAIGMWANLQGKLVLGSDVRQVLTYVDSGNAELGIVYSSDVIATQNVEILGHAKSDWHEPIVYPAALTTHSGHKEEAQVFMSYLLGELGREILTKNGFE